VRSALAKGPFGYRPTQTTRFHIVSIYSIIFSSSINHFFCKDGYTQNQAQAHVHIAGAHPVIGPAKRDLNNTKIENLMTFSSEVLNISSRNPSIEKTLEMVATMST
jgi:hypothetical protein